MNHWVSRASTMLVALALLPGAVLFIDALGGIPTVGAHAGNSNPAEVHACVNTFGHVRIVGLDRDCVAAETPLHWAIGGSATTVLWLVVDFQNGLVLRHNGHVRALTPAEEFGAWEVRFDRDVSACAPVATLRGGGAPSIAAIGPPPDDPAAVDVIRVVTFAEALFRGAPFSLAVFC